LQINLAEATAAPWSLQQARARTVMQYLADFRLTSELQSGYAGPAQVITIRIDPAWQG
jgi:hypothetical protein